MDYIHNYILKSSSGMNGWIMTKSYFSFAKQLDKKK